MDLHRAAFKMENSSYLPNPLASPALMVLASTAEASRDASIPCQQPRPFGVPVSVDKDVHIPFTNGSYTFASMYHRQGGVPGAFTNRDFPPSLLHLHPQFAPPNLDCTPISMLNHSGVGAFRPFASTEDRESYQSAFTPAKRLKNCHDTDSPHLRFSDADGKEYEFGAQLPSGSPGSLKVDDTGKKIFAVSGLISDRETSSSPEDRNDRYRSDSQGGPPASAGASQRMALTFPLCKKKATLFDSQAPICPICQVLLRPGELQEHMEQEMEKLTQLNIRLRRGTSSCGSPASARHQLGKNSILKDVMAPGTPKSILLSASIKREGDSPTASPHSSDDIHHSDRYQTFLRVRANRQTRLNARIGKMKRRKQDEGQVCPLCSQPLSGSEEERSRHVEQCLAKREGSCMMEDDAVDIENENGNRFEEYEWCGQKRIRATTLLEGGFREMPSTSNGESSKQEPMQKTCKNSDIEKITEDSAVTTFEALKARVRELERQLSRGDRYKCLICMDSYTMPLTSIQCWHVHCEECWLRTLGAKKLCPQCNTITSPGDLRRIYL
ncbi:E3 ubiquitin-protein ligase RNF220 isoform X6 [Podarcis muralis]|uniref:E3 ubiquitin-protein ligase RNF220 isoform X7 n=1 Tax=Podarcis muralis TaxID=64176 RepID=UPI0010A0AEAA|nr:E3 ubiquitin-protein ligase RNF220 isoform X7 [Podarcis muralis]